MDSLVVKASDSRPEGPGFGARSQQISSKYVLVKSVGPNVDWVAVVETTEAGEYALTSTSCLNSGDR
ncbi:hypothetical protein TNCV_2430111 [Trichonephila clavipes]|nr:hypothetical protein TNCV_2430111 [Trichonephila clavipes]